MCSVITFLGEPTQKQISFSAPPRSSHLPESLEPALGARFTPPIDNRTAVIVDAHESDATATAGDGADAAGLHASFGRAGTEVNLKC